MQHNKRASSGFEFQSVTRRMSVPFLLTAKQSQLVNRLVDGKVVVEGRTFTEAELYLAFKGVQLPRDEKVCEALDISRTSRLMKQLLKPDTSGPQLVTHHSN